MEAMGKEPDHWNRFFTELSREEMLKVCLAEEDCEARSLEGLEYSMAGNDLTLESQGDQAPYRLMFWEDISEEFLECIARGITPIWLGTAPIYEYVATGAPDFTCLGLLRGVDVMCFWPQERNVLLTRWRFETAAEMAEIIAMLSSPQGILEYGTRVFMERQGNYFLSPTAWP